MKVKAICTSQDLELFILVLSPNVCDVDHENQCFHIVLSCSYVSKKNLGAYMKTLILVTHIGAFDLATELRYTSQNIRNEK